MSGSVSATETGSMAACEYAERRVGLGEGRCFVSVAPVPLHPTDRRNGDEDAATTKCGRIRAG